MWAYILKTLTTSLCTALTEFIYSEVYQSVGYTSLNFVKLPCTFNLKACMMRERIIQMFFFTRQPNITAWQNNYICLGQVTCVSGYTTCFCIYHSIHCCKNRLVWIQMFLIIYYTWWSTGSSWVWTLGADTSAQLHFSSIFTKFWCSRSLGLYQVWPSVLKLFDDSFLLNQINDNPNQVNNKSWSGIICAPLCYRLVCVEYVMWLPLALYILAHWLPSNYWQWCQWSDQSQPLVCVGGVIDWP